MQLESEKTNQKLGRSYIIAVITKHALQPPRQRMREAC